MKGFGLDFGICYNWADEQTLAVEEIVPKGEALEWWRQKEGRKLVWESSEVREKDWKDLIL